MISCALHFNINTYLFYFSHLKAHNKSLTVERKTVCVCVCVCILCGLREKERKNIPPQLKLLFEA